MNEPDCENCKLVSKEHRKLRVLNSQCIECKKDYFKQLMENEKA